jgi:hypothetical protein
MIVFKNTQLSNNTVYVINYLLDLEIKSVAAFKLARIAKNLSSIIEDKNMAEKRIYDKWVILDENGKPMPVKDENGDIIPNVVSVKDAKEYNKEMYELMNYENKIDLPKLTFEELGVDFNIKPKDLLSIEFIFE